MKSKIVEIKINASYEEGSDKVKVKIDSDDKNGKSVLVKNFHTIAELYEGLDEGIKENVFKSVSETEEEKRKKSESVENVIQIFKSYDKNREINVPYEDYVVLIEFLLFLRDALKASKENVYENFNGDYRELLDLTIDFLSETITFMDSVRKEIYNVTSDRILKDLWINMILF